MFNPHPPLSSFPFPLFLVVLCFEGLSLLRWRRADFDTTTTVILVLAALSVGLSFFSGYYASDHANQTFMVSDDAIAAHHSIGRFLLFSAIPCLALRIFASRATFNQKTFWAVYYVALAFCVVLAGWSSYRGGELVFRHGAGVFAVPNGRFGK